MSPPHGVVCYFVLFLLHRHVVGRSLEHPHALTQIHPEERGLLRYRKVRTPGIHQAQREYKMTDQGKEFIGIAESPEHSTGDGDMRDDLLGDGVGSLRLGCTASSRSSCVSGCVGGCSCVHVQVLGY